MRTTGKGLYKWLRTKDDVYWPLKFRGMGVYFTYKEIRCFGQITKTHEAGKLIEAKIEIRPLSLKDNIGNGCGISVFKTFRDDANKNNKQ